MARKGFSTTFDPETTACARGKDMNCSPKASRNIAATIKGMRVGDAKTFLEEVIAKKTPVPYRYRYRKIKHRKGEGFGPGAYPVKAATKALQILVNAENNAEYKGLDAEDLRIVHASAYVGQIFQGFRPRAQGRATAHNEETTNLEIVLGSDERLDALDEAKDERRGRTSKRAGVKAKKTAKAAPAAEPEAEKSAEAESTETTADATESTTAPQGEEKKAEKATEEA
jgi:large subunit ribosomal protein L22